MTDSAATAIPLSFPVLTPISTASIPTPAPSSANDSSSSSTKRSSGDDASDDEPEGKEEKVAVTKVGKVIKEHVMLSLHLLKEFDFTKLWTECGGETTFLIKGDGLGSVNGLVPVWVLEASLMAVICGSTGTDREEFICLRNADNRKGNGRGLSRALLANKLYSGQLEKLLKQESDEKYQDYLMLADPRDKLESNGCVPQLQWNTVITVPIQDEVDGKGMEDAALDAGKGTVVAVDANGIRNWMLANVVGVDKATLERYTGKLPAEYLEMPPADFATWVDTAVGVDAVAARKAAADVALKARKAERAKVTAERNAKRTRATSVATTAKTTKVTKAGDSSEEESSDSAKRLKSQSWLFDFVGKLPTTSFPIKL